MYSHAKQQWLAAAISALHFGYVMRAIFLSYTVVVLFSSPSGGDGARSSLSLALPVEPFWIWRYAFRGRHSLQIIVCRACICFSQLSVVFLVLVLHTKANAEQEQVDAKRSGRAELSLETGRFLLRVFPPVACRWVRSAPEVRLRTYLSLFPFFFEVEIGCFWVDG